MNEEIINKAQELTETMIQYPAVADEVRFIEAFLKIYVNLWILVNQIRGWLLEIN